MNVVARNSGDLTARLNTLPADVVGAIVVGANPADLDLIRRWVRLNRQCAVVTDQTLTAVVAAAELLTTLTHHGLPPRRTRVVIAGAATTALLRRLLMAAGVAEVTNWDRRDAVSFPLHLIIRDAEAVIDLLDCPQEIVGALREHPDLIVITRDDQQCLARALPIILHSIMNKPKSKLSIDDYYSWVISLVAAAPADGSVSHPVKPPSGADEAIVMAHRLLANGARPNYTSAAAAEHQRRRHARGGIPWRQRSLRATVDRYSATTNALSDGTRQRR
jgi:hypothetical protein